MIVHNARTPRLGGALRDWYRSGLNVAHHNQRLLSVAQRTAGLSTIGDVIDRAADVRNLCTGVVEGHANLGCRHDRSGSIALID
jgi:hypothetical protein